MHIDAAHNAPRDRRPPERYSSEKHLADDRARWMPEGQFRGTVHVWADNGITIADTSEDRSPIGVVTVAGPGDGPESCREHDPESNRACGTANLT